jgi:hypothetical protein
MGWYEDRHGRERIAIDSDGAELSVVIRGVTFAGDDFDGLEPTGDLPDEPPFPLYGGSLCECELEWTVPVPVIVTGGGTMDGSVECRLRLGAPRPAPQGGIDAEELTLVLRFGRSVYRTERPHGYFESALDDLQRGIPPGTLIKACISCAWSDYSPVGNPLFGGLACFRGNKDGYRRVTTKREIFEVWDTHTEYVQETYVCDEYEVRGPNAGYRGSFPSSAGPPAAD